MVYTVGSITFRALLVASNACYKILDNLIVLSKQNNQKQVFLIFVLILSTSFYFFPSGYPQPGNVLVAIFVVFVFALRHYPKISLQAPEKLLLIFWFYSTLVNVIFWWFHKDASFIISSAYWTFGIALLLGLRKFYLVKRGVGEAFIWSFLVAAFIQTFIFAVGDESFYFGKRFIGTFNDPNQFSYWFLCLFVASLLSQSRPGWLNHLGSLVVFMMLCFLIVLSSSRSAILGTAVLFIGMLWWMLSTLGGKNRVNRNVSALGPAGLTNSHSRTLSCGTLLLITLAGLFVLGGVVLILFHFNSAVHDVILDLVHRTLSQNIYSQLEIRGYTHLVEYPQYLLFGAGQGYDLRFRTPIGGIAHEIHSSFASPLFYYGVIGFLLLFSALYLLARDRLRGWQWLVFAAPFVYGLTTYGLRTPVFWVMLSSLYTIQPKHSLNRE